MSDSGYSSDEPEAMIDQVGPELYFPFENWMDADLEQIASFNHNTATHDTHHSAFTARAPYGCYPFANHFDLLRSNHCLRFHSYNPFSQICSFRLDPQSNHQNFFFFDHNLENAIEASAICPHLDLEVPDNNHVLTDFDFDNTIVVRLIRVTVVLALGPPVPFFVRAYVDRRYDSFVRMWGYNTDIEQYYGGQLIVHGILYNYVQYLEILISYLVHIRTSGYAEVEALEYLIGENLHDDFNNLEFGHATPSVLYDFLFCQLKYAYRAACPNVPNAQIEALSLFRVNSLDDPVI